jgi:hypothetical protein
MAVNAMQALLTTIDITSFWGSHSGSETILFIAQTTSTDLFSNVQQAWNNFVQSGQIWALIGGFVLGYLFRSITAY